MSIIIGSARADENYKYVGGRRGDQRQKSSHDMTGEVSMQEFYVGSKGWFILRPKSDKHAEAIAKAMRDACNNKHIGYSQSDRYVILSCKEKNGEISKDVNCDCSSLVRKCIIDGTGKDVGDFTTVNEAAILEKSGLFEDRKVYKAGVELYSGDVLVTKSKGHTVIVVSGDSRNKTEQKKTCNISGKVSYTIGVKYAVKTEELNMRKGPGTSYDIIMVLKENDKLTCKHVKKVDGAVWISNGAGWVCATTSSGKVYVG